MSVHLDRFGDLLKEYGVPLVRGLFFERDVFTWFPDKSLIQVVEALKATLWQLFGLPTRATQVSSETKKIFSRCGGSYEGLAFSQTCLRNRRNSRRRRALSTDFLSHAFLDNYDVAILFAGAGDYLEQVKRQGKTVCMAFFCVLPHPTLRTPRKLLVP